MKNYALQQSLQHCVGGRLALSDAKERRKHEAAKQIAQRAKPKNKPKESDSSFD
jgi:hypothetical protein